MAEYSKEWDLIPHDRPNSLSAKSRFLMRNTATDEKRELTRLEVARVAPTQQRRSYADD